MCAGCGMSTCFCVCVSVCLCVNQGNELNPTYCYWFPFKKHSNVSASCSLWNHIKSSWGFCCWNSSHWICSRAQGFLLTQGSWPGVRETDSQPSCSGIVCEDSLALTWLQNGGDLVGDLVVKCGRCQQNIKYFEGKQVEILTGKQIKPGPPNSSFLALFGLFWQLTNCW